MVSSQRKFLTPFKNCHPPIKNVILLTGILKSLIVSKTEAFFQSFSGFNIFFYFNVKRTIWHKGYQNGNHIEPSEQRLQEISIAKN